MKKIFSKVVAGALVLCMATLSLSIPSKADNPVVQNIYTADPAPMVSGDTLYLYTTHDEDKLVKNFYTMNDWKCYSTKDMVNWTDHGTVLSRDNFKWMDTKDPRAWAPQCVERNGKFYMYVPVHKKYLMIDTAKSGYNGGKSQAKMLILKYLMDRGIKNIDTIIVTHFDNDHCGGAVDLMEGVSVKNLYVNSLNHDSNAAKQIYKRANLRGVKLILAENNQTVIDKDGLVIRNYICNEPGVGDNESSVLTLLHYKNFSMLFTGDSGVDTFMKLKNYLPQNITVLKVGHHGANGVVNKEMLEYLNPKYALISTGINKFGHPTIYTVAILRDRTILRTDINNSIRFVVNDKGYNTFVFDTKKKKYIAK